MPPTTEPALPAVVYARYSTDGQDARSIADQIRRCRAHASARGYRIVAEFSDAAMTGAHDDRPDLRRLLAQARAKGGSPFRAVFIDDLSRLSRDLGDSWRIVFRDLASANVRVVDVTTGLGSDDPGARLTFGAMALVNDTFLQLVRAETHRGLEGRALAGFSTGGRCYGYAAIQEENPPDPEHPRKRLIADPEQAAVVLRIFQLFAEGVALKRIASELNEKGLTAPNDDGRGNKNGRGWGHTTIRAMLGNERYLGRFAWNQSKWVRVPGRKSRKRVMRPESEWIARTYPELAIVPKELWDAVQARLVPTLPVTAGRPTGTGKHRGNLLSGLLRCGTCGGSIVIVSRKMKAGLSFARLGCTTHNSRGPAICGNSMRISEKKASHAVIGALKEKLDKPELVEHFIASFKRRAAALQRENGDGLDEADQRIREYEKRIANLTDALAKVGWSDALASKLRDEEALLNKLKAERTATAKRAQPRIVPDATTIAGYLRNLFPLLERDPVRGREILARFVAPIVMTPETEGPARRYRATGAFNLSFLLEAAAKGGKGGDKSGCAGRI